MLEMQITHQASSIKHHVETPCDSITASRLFRFSVGILLDDAFQYNVSDAVFGVGIGVGGKQ
jgi:hypothetical protein